jgi:hypothetical protein
MKTFGIIVGTNDQPISKKYYLKNKTKFECLKDLLDDLNYIPYDYAIYAEAKSHEKKYNVQIIPLDGGNLSIKDCNKCNAIFTIYEGTIAFMEGGIELFNNYINTLSKTTAKVYPSVKMQKFILYKELYMQYLDKKGYEIINTKYISMNSYKNDKTKELNSIQKYILNNDYNKIIFKPELSAFKRGVKIYKNPKIKSIETYLNKINKTTDYKNLLLQPFLENFNKYWEIKTYWILGKHIFSYGQKFNKNDEGIFTKPVSQGGKLDDNKIKPCIKIGKKIIKDLFNDKEILVQCRIDFGCCIENDINRYFINEIEISPTLNENDSHTPYFNKLSEAIVKHLSNSKRSKRTNSKRSKRSKSKRSKRTKSKRSK